VDVRHGQEHAMERKFFPGYVLAKMELTDEVYHLIKNTPRVSDFFGTHKKPIPITGWHHEVPVRQTSPTCK
jgi:transcriptional antiterminator NusG